MIKKYIQNITKLIPKYWPIGAFIHHNPLLGFEDKKFQDGLNNAKEVFNSKVYMPSDYYVDLYNENKINKEIFEKNISTFLNTHDLQEHLPYVKNFLLDISPKSKYYRSYEKTSDFVLDKKLFNHIKDTSIYDNYDHMFESLTSSMTLYEINDAIFDTNFEELILKDTIEYISRYLNEDQYSLSMHQREFGMFTTFKYYEDIQYNGESDIFIKEIVNELCVKEIEKYLLSHLLKLSGWAGFIKYRSSNEDYYFQQLYPSAIEDFLAIKLYYEKTYLKNANVSTFNDLNDYYNDNKHYTILKILKYKLKLSNIHADKIEHNFNYKDILNEFIEEEIRLDTLQSQAIQEQLNDSKINSIEFYKFFKLLEDNQGYLWLKTVEDGHIDNYIDKIIEPHKPIDTKPLASAVFCIDVRSENIRRNIENTGAYTTYGMAGFLGIPLSFIEFDKGHEQFLCPAVLKPNNIIFELPSEELSAYKKLKVFSKTVKKVLSDLKNNPYTPFIMVEAIGWLFSLKLFGKTFFPNTINKFFKKFQPKTPKTNYTIDQLSKEDIEKYTKILHLNIIKEACSKEKKLKLNNENILEIWMHIIFNKKLTLDISSDFLSKIINEYNINKEDYEFQKNKLSSVGFELEEQIEHSHRILKTMSLTKIFPKFIIMVSHGSCSDNNPFESALDCGACGGNSSLPNTRAFTMMINKQDVREGLKQRGITIPNDVLFIPAAHNTVTDDITFYDTHIVNKNQQSSFNKVKEDFKISSHMARQERLKLLPHANNDDDLYIKSIDWSETRPEWGLAGNTMAYVGNRESTKNINLHNKIFLQSYNWEEDNEEAELLASLYEGPLIVGEWINMEHYFSTVDNQKFGSGSKVYHNIVSKVGVFEGNYSDLRIGLPSQTVMLENKAFHEPTRLIVFLECPLEYALKALEKAPIASKIIMNEWVRLVLIDKRAKKVYLLEDEQMKVIREIE